MKCSDLKTASSQGQVRSSFDDAMFWQSGLRMLALFLCVLGARLWQIHAYGNAVPFADQWDAEADRLIKPYLEGSLHWRDLFAPHNEHPIFCTRLLVLGLFLFNGQWDPLLEMSVNTVLCAVMAVMFVSVLDREFQQTNRLANALIVGFFFILPYAWENTLCGFQSQFYLLLFFSLSTLWALSNSRVFSLKWFLGVISGVLACLCMASGGFSSLAVIGLIGLRRLRARRWLDRDEWITVFVCVLTFVLGWHLKGYNPGHEPLKAHSVSEFLSMMGRCMAWPYFRQPSWAFWMYLPLVALILIYLFPVKIKVDAKSSSRPVAELLLGVGLWVGLQMAGISYARGAQGSLPSSRYMDLLALGIAINCFSLILLLMHYTVRGAICRHIAAVFGGCWLLVLFRGLSMLTVENFTVDLPAKLECLRLEEQNVRAFIMTGNRTWLENKPFLAISYPNAKVLVGFLSDPTIRKILPENVRRPIPLEIERDTAFTQDGVWPLTTPQLDFVPTYGSYVASNGGDCNEGEMTAHLAFLPTLPYLSFELAGYLGKEGLSLSWWNSRRARWKAFEPTKIAAEHWETEYFKSPKIKKADRLRLMAVDHNPESWFAFHAPVEVGRLSYWSRFMLSRGALLFSLGAFGIGVLYLLNWLNGLDSLPPRLGLMVATMFAVTAVLFFRKPDALIHPQFWAEDAREFFKQNYEVGAKAFMAPYAGYLHFVPRLVAWLAGLFPILLQPAFYTYATLALTLLTVAKLFDQRLPWLPFQRVGLSLALVLVPHTGEVFLNITNIQWILAPSLLLLLILQKEPANFRSLVGDFLILAAAGLTGPFIILLFPFFVLWLLFVSRTKYFLYLSFAASLLCVAQGYYLVHSPRIPKGGGFDWLSAAEICSVRLGAQSLVGVQIADHLSLVASILLFLGLFLGPLFLAWKSRQGVALAVCLLQATAASMTTAALYTFKSTLSMLLPFQNGDRYFYSVRVLAAWSLILCLGDERKPPRMIAGTLLCLLLLASFTSFQAPWLPAQDWWSAAQKLERGKGAAFVVNPNWKVQVGASVWVKGLN